MSKPPYWICRMPVLSTSHVTRSTMDWLLVHEGDRDFGTVAIYTEGAFIYLRGLHDPPELPQELLALQSWVQRRRYGWIRLDTDGDVVPGLPLHNW